MEDLELELALFQSAHEDELQLAALAKEEAQAQAQAKEMENEARWTVEAQRHEEESAKQFAWYAGNGLANDWYPYFGMALGQTWDSPYQALCARLNSVYTTPCASPRQGCMRCKMGKEMSEACRNAVRVEVLDFKGTSLGWPSAVECWARDGPYPSPWRREATVVMTICKVVSLSDDGSHGPFLVELVLLNGDVIEVNTLSDIYVSTLAKQIQLERDLDASVVLIGPSGDCLSSEHPSEPISNLICSENRSQTQCRQH